MPSLATTKEVLFVAGGIQTGFLEEQHIGDCVEQIDEFIFPHMTEFEHTYDIVVDIPSCSTPVSDVDVETTSSD
jgi:hypothetical protein